MNKFSYTEDDKTRLLYSCFDGAHTSEVFKALQEDYLGESKAINWCYDFQRYKLNPLLLKMMVKGVKVSLKEKDRLHEELTLLSESINERLKYIVGEDWNPRSNTQLPKLFCDLLGLSPFKKDGKVTFNSVAMYEMLKKYPTYKRLFHLILEQRSLNIFATNFFGASVGDDGRLHTSFDPTGTPTFRLASRKDVFGNGLNMQNIASKGKIPLEYAIDTQEERFLHQGSYGELELPNCKKIIIPDTGKTFFDIDFSAADARVVAADSGCDWLLNFFETSKMKLAQYLASEFYQREIKPSDKEYATFKAWNHGTHYKLGEVTASQQAGISLKEARKLKKWYFSFCPEIPKWHDRIEEEIKKKGYVTNCFGARLWQVDLTDPTWLNKAIASKPQSTIAWLVNVGMVNIDEELYKEGVDVLIQVHDSVAGQFPTDKEEELVPKIINCMETPIYDGMIIPVDIKTSKVSYGDCG